MKTVVVYAQGSPSKMEPYLEKLSQVFDSIGVSYEFRLWSREKCLETSNRKVLLQKTASSKFNLFFAYVIWVSKVINNCWRGTNSDNIFFCSRFETALSCYLISLFSNISYVYIDRDAIHLSYKWNVLMKYFLKEIEIKVANRAVAHILPGVSRSYSTNPKEYIVNNSPSSKTLELALASTKYDYLSGVKELKVYVNGWLVESRGLSDILHSATVLPNIKFIVAGRVGCDEALQLTRLQNVHFLGSIPNEDALSIYKYMDVVLTLYDTTIDVNRKAEPNKWFDCFAMSVPFITNTDVETAAGYLSEGYCFQYRYGDYASLIKLLAKFEQEPTILHECKSKLCQKQIEPWDMKMEDVIRKVIKTQ